MNLCQSDAIWADSCVQAAHYNQLFPKNKMCESKKKKKKKKKETTQVVLLFLSFLRVCIYTYTYIFGEKNLDIM